MSRALPNQSVTVADVAYVVTVHNVERFGTRLTGEAFVAGKSRQLVTVGFTWVTMQSFNHNAQEGQYVGARTKRANKRAERANK